MIIKVLEWVLDVDVEKTRAFYEKAPYITDECKCVYCKNYFGVSKNIPSEVKDLYDKLGLIINKEPEVYEQNKNENGTYLYGGMCLICGKIVSKPKDRKYIELCKNFEVFFDDENTIPFPERFPLPKFQMDFLWDNVPWVLKESPGDD